VSRNLLDEQYVSIFLPDSNTQVLTLTPADGRLNPQSYLAMVFNFDTFESNMVILSANEPLLVGE